ncbi:MAG TPA: amino acid permease [Phenylobacterium sp.]|uniref:amino acid permease n=1 Tax=Phenylobacterium sp. TaxID=1871053 RepID=UPI002D3B7B74|nr:amino acid permease [Phenylobacterium sp.]HZZ68441.1 amino acid permease [Phenylobacterium sp.]
MWRVKSLDQILATAEKKSLHRSLGPVQLTMLGIGAVIGTGIFVLTATAAQKAGPGMMVSFIIAGAVCAVAALCYSELASMVPVAGSAYTYSYAVMGELVAWLVGWALILEYALGASAVAVGWSGHMVGLLDNLGMHLPHALTVGPKVVIGNFLEGGEVGGFINLPAVIITALVTILLIVGTKESATANAVLVAIKVAALTLFVAVTLPMISGHADHFKPFVPRGWGNPFDHTGTGVLGAAASIFFAYVGFDAVSTAAEETRNPQRNVPIGLIASLLICTIFYLLAAGGAIGSYGAQPLAGPDGVAYAAGSPELASACTAMGAHTPLVCSKEALAYVMREIGHPFLGQLIALAATVALPSVVLMMMYGQTRIFFVMARDGLLPPVLSTVHPRFKTPWIITLVTGVVVAVFAAFLPVGQLADYSNSGTLFAFAAVSLGVMILRFTDKTRARPFKTPAVFVIAPLSIIGCLVLFVSLDGKSQGLFVVWTLIGLVFYFTYGFWRSNVRRGVDESEPLVDGPGGTPL